MAVYLGDLVSLNFKQNMSNEKRGLFCYPIIISSISILTSSRVIVISVLSFSIFKNNSYMSSDISQLSAILWITFLTSSVFSISLISYIRCTVLPNKFKPMIPTENKSIFYISLSLQLFLF